MFRTLHHTHQWIKIFSHHHNHTILAIKQYPHVALVPQTIAGLKAPVFLFIRKQGQDLLQSSDQGHSLLHLNDNIINKNFGGMQILLREVSIVLKLLSRIIVVKFNFNLTRTFNYFSKLGLFFIFSVSRQFCNFYNVL